MKTYKKTISMLLSLVLMVSAVALLGGCEKKSPKELFNNAVINIKNAKDIKIDDAKFTSVMDVNGQKVKSDADLSCHLIKSTTNDSRDIQAKIAFSMNNAANNVVDMNLYIKDRMVYLENGKSMEKAKLPIDKQNFEKLLGVFSKDQPMKIDEFVKEEKQDGDKLIFQLDGKKYITDKLKKFGGGKIGSKEFKNFEKQLDVVNIKKLELEADVEDEQFTAIKYNICINVDKSVSGTKNQNGEMNITFDMPKISVDSGEKIQFPDLTKFK